ncbi:MAG: hypothetical protein IJJ99_04160 [Oscillospiraceae bacterium]|nr:hypothetical protein [Oscillospiraceae bacterium]
MKQTIAIFLLIAVLLLTACTPGGRSDYETALSFVNQPISALKEQIGEPKSVSYASSCLGDGEDGELYYEGFTVYTYRDTDGTENVYDVMKTAD